MFSKTRDLKHLVNFKRFESGRATYLLYVRPVDGLRGTTPATQPRVPRQSRNGPRKGSQSIHTTKHFPLPGEKNTQGLVGETSRLPSSGGPQDQSRGPRGLASLPSLGLCCFERTQDFCILVRFFVCQKSPFLPFQAKEATELGQGETKFLVKMRRK